MGNLAGSFPSFPHTLTLFINQRTGNLKSKDVCQVISREEMCVLTYL